LFVKFDLKQIVTSPFESVERQIAACKRTAEYDFNVIV